MPHEYQRKRDFRITPEPPPDGAVSGVGPLRFVVQKHAARRLHYDLRLECDGVLKSWAVPKGPSLNTADRRLAVMTEDHPLSYADFEGVIPAGQYGGGEVIIWDEGVYVADDGPGKIFPERGETERRIREGIPLGKLSFTLYGKKLKGSFTLVKTSKGDWLLIKHQDGAVTTEDVLLQDRSVRSGRTPEDLESGATANSEFRWMAGAVQSPLPAKPLPMLPTEVDKPFRREGWTFETKLDGIRLLAVIEKPKVKLVTRSGRDVAAKFPGLTEHLRALPVQSAILDGEVVRFGEDGKASFGQLMERFHLENEREIRRQDSLNPVVFCIFDLTYLNGWDLTKSALEDRIKALAEVDPASPYLRRVDSFPTEGELVFEQATALGFEGVVAKKLSSGYDYGVRSANWLKLKKVHTEEFLIGGFTDGQNSRSDSFGALLVGRPGEDGKLQFAGSVGGGFTDSALREVRDLLGESQAESPFSGPIETNGKPTFVEPKHWAEVRYGTTTAEGLLRFPIFERLRPDLAAGGPVPKGPSDWIESVLAQLETNKEEIQLEVGEDRFRVTSLSRVLWPGPGLTKRDLLKYLARISPLILPHLQNRPLSIVRYPDGLGGESFFQKHLEGASPDFVEHIRLWSSHNKGAREFLTCNNLATLLWLGQLASLELHPWYSRNVTDPDLKPEQYDTWSSDEAMDRSALNVPDFMVFDLDPNLKEEAKGTFVRDQYARTVRVALKLKEMLEPLGLRSFVKSSGKSGLHIYVPLARVYDYDEVRAMAEAFGRHLERIMPQDVTMEWTVSKRPNKVFFDHNQNVRGKTLASIYSPRAAPWATISCPVPWAQLEAFDPQAFTIQNAQPDNLPGAREWAEMLSLRQRIA